ncbi:vWA domain-containing protein [Candidatus Methylomicrobium oryzae]|jgi:uncharacterized protein YegL|uniref:vWA domain-containing protein n=1 Tax=Candidatus Methylomicrobium oryzae TaxID=2802053 RepID=UPI001920A593|nr:VWA domain-containing protein [Methylomicrobium sp. RS1]MBL1263462.1 VWA domain-containing protein [Methylomicrobium sp. RS1]
MLNPEFAINPESRCPCVLLLDTSGSMEGSPINELNQGLQEFAKSLKDDSLASLRVEVAVVTFDSNVTIVQDFITASNFQAPILTAQGGTDMAGGINKALDLIELRKKEYRGNVTYYRPWVFMITDGAPNPGWEPSAQRIKNEEKNKQVTFFAVGVEGADMGKLKDIIVRPPFQLRGLNFQGLFVWLSSSLARVSQSRVGEQVGLQAPGSDILV